MHAPGSAQPQRCGLLEFASILIKVAISLAMIAGLLPQFGISQTVPARPRVAAGQITFPATLLPKVPASLPVVKLTAPAAPEALLRETLSRIGVANENIQPLSHSSLLSLRSAPESIVGVVQEDHLIARWNQQSGVSEILPQLEKLPRTTYVGANDPHLAQALTVARQVFARTDFLPSDVTTLNISDPRAVVGRTAQRSSATATPQSSASQLVLSYVAASRSVKGYSVYGPGSHAAVAIGTDGNLYGLVARWKAASFSGTVTERRTPAQLQSDLRALLQPYTANSNVEVISVEIAYFDNDQDAMTAVYRVVSSLHPLAASDAKLQSDTDYIASYLAYGNGQLPADLVPGSGAKPAVAPADHAALQSVVLPEGDPAVGMYVVRDAPSGSNPSSGFVAESNGFWNGLHSSNGASQFTLAQYYWAVPAMYSTDAPAFVNDVNIALTEAHGAPWEFSTESNCCDVVYINNIPSTEGYGAATRGKLDYWIIHSCDVVPSASDDSAWWTPWFKVFQGLHAVMGSRTEMLFDSGAVNTPFGQNIGDGASVVSSWFNATLSYYPASKQPPLDRPSAVTVCGHEPDTAFNTTPLPAASCLTNYWVPN